MTNYMSSTRKTSILRSFWNMEERLREVVRYIGASALAEKTSITNRRRWQTVATELKTKTRIEDLVELLKAYPQYELYVLHGQIDPATGQVSPSYEQADIKLEKAKAGSR